MEVTEYMKNIPVQITIRSAAAEDAARIAELSRQLGYPVTAEEAGRRLESIQALDDHALSVAVLPVGEVAGWIHIYVRRTVMLDPIVEVDGLIVDEAHRGTGIGGQLMGHAEEWALSRGISVVNLRSNVIREDTHAFYRRLGYEHVKQQMVFRKMLR